MSDKIGDVLIYQNERYELAGLSGRLPFSPQQHGLEPHCNSAACRRGYWCEFALEGERLKLDMLYLFNKDDQYPPLNGVEVSPPEYDEVTLFRMCMPVKEKVPAHLGHRVYRHLELPMPYSGKILAGRDLRGHSLRRGLQRGWGYKTLLEFEFEEGRLTVCRDHSTLTKRQRKALQKEWQSAASLQSL